MNDLVGINVGSLEVLAIKILRWNDDVVQALNDIEDAIANSKSFYDCSSGETLRLRMSDTKPCYVTVQENLEIYSQDLIRVKDALSNMDIASTTIVNKGIDNLKSQTNTLIQ